MTPEQLTALWKALQHLIEMQGDMALRLHRIEAKLNGGVTAPVQQGNGKLNEITPEERKRIREGGNG